MTRTTAPWEEVVSKKRALRDSSLAPFLVHDLDSPSRKPVVGQDVSQRSEFPTSERKETRRLQEITEVDDVQTLQECLSRGQFTAEEVVFAFIRRSAMYNTIGVHC